MTTPLLLAVVVLPAAASLLIAALRPTGPSAARVAVRATALAFLAAVAVFVAVATDGAVAAVVEGADGRALVGLHADRVGAVLALLTTGVGLVVQSFSARALQGDLRATRFFALTTLLTAATTVVALSATLGLLAAAWVVVGLALVALVAHHEGWDPAVRAARLTRRSLLVGDVALVAASLVALATVGEVDLRAPQEAADALAGAGFLGVSGGALTVVAVLLTAAGVSRSALVPLHRWLPATVAGPTPVSALLHAGVVNGAGVLLVRLAPVFGASTTATHLALVAGTVTALYATAVMLVRSDVKGNLAWSTAGQMGFMTVQVAVGAFAAALFHLVGHGMYKAALFLGSGGSVQAHLRHDQRPGPLAAAPRAARLATALLAPAGALVLAYLVADPNLPAAADLLVVVFAFATAARAVDGWVRAAPFAPLSTLVLAAAASVVAVLAYVVGLGAFEGFVLASLPKTVPGAVDLTVLVVLLVVVGLVAGGLWLAPGERGRDRRQRVWALLLSTSAPLPSRARRGDPAPATTPAD
jgi:NADH:ubiquinone oxidoreductase subunit 5 (subunit L)/multisubunit Na+/H+ antiporter MnhA subunit